MAKFYTMLTFLIVTILLFNFAGVMTSTGYIINIVLHPDTAISSPLLLAIGLVFAAIGITGVFLGAFVFNYAQNTWQVAMLVSIIPALFVYLLGDMGSIFLIIYDSNHSVAILVCGTLLLTWIFGIMDWWNGRN